MLRWNSNKPVNGCRDEWERIGSGVEDTEPGAVLCRRVLAWWRQELLHASLPVLRLATVVRVVEVHDSVGLPRVR
jgi:hypothetical protein